ANVFPRRVVNRNVDRIVVGESVIGVVPVSGDDFGFVGEFGFQKSAQALFFESVHAARLKSYLAVAFNCANDNFLISCAATFHATSPFLAFVHPFSSAAYVGFVGLYKAAVEA